MRVCKVDLDNFDPWRLPARKTENITLRFPRPDVSVATGPIGGDELQTQGAPNEEGNSVFITQTQEQATTAGESGNIKI
jgi:hypothetical protein